MEARRADVDELEATVEETTRAGEEWPIPEPYRVGGPASATDVVEDETVTPGSEEPGSGEPGAEDGGTVVVAPAGRPRMRGIPLDRAGIPLAAALGGALVLLALVVLVPLLASSTDPEAEAGRTTTPGAEGAVVSAPKQGSSAAPASQNGTRVAVPDVQGDTVAAAGRALREAGLKIETRPAESERPKGTVLEQDPGAGDRADRGSTIVLVVSSGSSTVTVPDVVGLRVDRASRRVRSEGLGVDVRTVRSSERPAVVLEQRPSAGESLDRDGRVQLTVAKSPPAVTTVRMPDLVGLQLDQAKSRLSARGLRWTVVEVPSSRPEGVVIRQSARVGAVVEKGTRVTLQVSSGPELLIVPDVVGLDVVVARQQLEAAGFVVLVTDSPTTDPAEDGIVLEQSPSGGTRVPKGAEVTLSVGLAG